LETKYSYRSSRGRTVLHLVLSAADVNKIFEELKQDPDLLRRLVFTRDNDERTVVHIASALGNANIMKAWLDGITKHFPDDPTLVGELVSAQDKDGNTPLHLAVIGMKALNEGED